MTTCERCKSPISGPAYDMGSAARYCEPCAVIEYRALPGSMLLKILPAFALAALCACAPMSARPVYPPLPSSVHRIPDGEIYAKCARAWPLWQHIVMFPFLPLGCAERYPQHNVCIVWVGETSAPWVVAHELEHCAGHVHD